MEILEGKLYDDLLRITKLRAPHEAVGLVIDGSRVVELTNISGSPSNTFEVFRSQIIAALADVPDPSAVIFWHSHPSGGVGPSQTDLQQRTPFTSHLVVSLSDGELIASWY